MNVERSIEGSPLPDLAETNDWALFLDLDGTLLDLAPSPDSAVVPADLVETLAALHCQLSGALAIATGRPLAIVDKFLSPFLLPVAAEHGAILRDANGILTRMRSSMRVPKSLRAEIRLRARAWPGVLIEEKQYSVALHYRQNPKLAEIIQSELKSLIFRRPEFEILTAVMAFEIRHTLITKGAALKRLMETSDFQGRRPAFIGDDITDEDGIAAAVELGGIGLRVKDHFGGTPAKVRDWLKSQLRNS